MLVLMIEAGDLPPRGAAVATADLSPGRGPTGLFFAGAASGESGMSRQDAVF